MNFSDEILHRNQAFYDSNARQYCDTTKNLSMGCFHESFAQQLPSVATILDAGCGSGRDSLIFQRLGFRVTAIDASLAMVHQARDIGVDASALTFQEITWEHCFDGIWASASLLHVPKTEMISVLRRLRRALKRDGFIFISLKEGEGERVEADGRFFDYFSADEFAAFLSQSGFEVVAQSRSEPDARSRQGWLQFFAQPRSTSNSSGRVPIVCESFGDAQRRASHLCAVEFVGRTIHV